MSLGLRELNVSVAFPVFKIFRSLNLRESYRKKALNLNISMLIWGAGMEIDNFTSACFRVLFHLLKEGEDNWTGMTRGAQIGHGSFERAVHILSQHGLIVEARGPGVIRLFRLTSKGSEFTELLRRADAVLAADPS